ncbi:PIN domain-containing protein [Frankia sp. Cas4]|uniref:PIN domain-containing protein n=1 Tax=Frankia sp. Cas4 TaxID=3073927 RepID=UPI002AD2CA25|nr:PIN domain-containing protein [Frankia sp. Cas4]
MVVLLALVMTGRDPLPLTRVAGDRGGRDDVATLLDAVVAVTEHVRLAFLWRPTLRDPDDDMVLETAVNGHAEWIVTFNRRDFGTVTEQFEIGVCTPAAALKMWEEQL